MIENWMIQIISVFLVSFGLDLVQKIVFKRIRLQLENSNKVWKDAAICALQAPARVLLWTSAVAVALQILEKAQQLAFFSSLFPYCNIVVLIIFAWFFLRFIRQVGEKLHISQRKKGSHFDKTTFDAISKLLHGGIIAVAILTILQTLGISISGMLAFGGISGIAFGFASKDLLANLFGSFMIYWDRPFAIGDWIRSPDRQIEGPVEQIGWRSTLIRTQDKRPLYVPNSIFTSIIVENPSRMSHRKIRETINLRHEDSLQIPQILEELRDLLRHSSEIDQEQVNIVHFTAFGSSSFEVLLEAYTQVTDHADFHRLKEALLFKIFEVIRFHGAEIALPSMVVQLPVPIAQNPSLKAQKLSAIIK